MSPGHRYDAVLFDVDDTLLDFRASEEVACSAVFHLYPVRSLSPDAFLAAFQNANDSTWDLYMQKRITQAEVADKTFEDLARLLPMSNCVDTHDAALTFEEAFAEQSVVEPDARVFDHALQLLDMTAKQCLFVGDSIISDDTGARNAGMDFCWYRRHHAALFAPTTAVGVIQSLIELPVLLDVPDISCR